MREKRLIIQPSKLLIHRLGFILVIFLLVISTSTLGQNRSEIDSLLQVASTDIPDKDKVDIYVAIARQYSNTDSVNTTTYADQAIKLADQISYHEGKAQALYQIGWVTMIMGHYTEAEPYFEQMLALANTNDYKKEKADALNGIGQINSYLGNLEKALESFFQSLQLREELKDKSGISGSHNNIGMLYMHKGNFEEALKHYLQTLEVRKELNDKPNIALVSTNIGIIYEKLGEYEKALDFQLDALRLAKEVGYTRTMAIAETNLGHLYAESGKYQRAVEHLHESMRLIEQMGSESNKLYPLLILGRTHYKMGQYGLARKYISQGIEYAKQTGLISSIQAGSEQLVLVEEAAGNYKAAYEAHVLYKQMQDSLNNEDVTKRITRLEAEYEFQKEKDSIQFENERSLMAKNTEIQLLNEKEKVSRLRMLGFVGFSAFIITIGFFIARSKVRAKESQAIALREIGAFKEAMTGMIAHDLKNPLSIILNNKDVDKNQRTARQMLQLINNMLDVQKFEAARMPLDLKMVDLESLVTSARKQVEMLAGQSNIKITVDTQSLQVNADHEILERVLVNLLTNAIKYSPLNSEIKVSVREKEGQAELSVVDAGSGIAEEDQELVFESFGQSDPRMSGGVGSTGLGLTFCKLAVEAHGSRLDLVSDRGRGTTFSFNLDLFSKSEMEAAEVRTPQLYLTMSADEQQAIAACIPKLKSLNLYQISEIERELEVLKGSSDRVINDWVDAVLDAAYTGNGQRYEELLKEAERLN
ncbi:tetratricopeptide repeat-containing sensor histidine kinase [Reichenbachiella sp.]|uniref:tetratricopeptide repeat-containing sensor histidine kinase n=1 Tax=Reichenbachiella sp. TaxID=2184521 RepID=UPI003265E8B4